MSSRWTAEQILALAPDAASAKAGRGLAAPSPWRTTGNNEQAAWGECQGSGKLPYQTIVALDGPAFKCSCPSRKFPCKHGLGLLLLRAQLPGQFAEGDPPEWVSSWLAGRAQRAEAKEKKEAAPPTEASVAAANKRAAGREARVEAGLAELDLWLRDLMREGIAQAPQRDYKYWDAPAARLTDAQAPGLARWVRDLAGLAASGPGWQARLLDQVGRIVLLREAYRRQESLTEEERHDVRALLGFAQSQEDVLEQPAVRDRWLVVGRTTEQEEQLRVQRTWLQGQATGRFALLLHFAAGKTPLDVSLPPGVLIDAELCFYPGTVARRAIIKERHAVIHSAPEPAGAASILQAHRECRRELAIQPWQRPWPVALQSVSPVPDHGRWWVRDAEGHALPLHTRFAQPWMLMALSGGHPLWMFGEWDGEQLMPLAVRHEGGLMPLESAR